MMEKQFQKVQQNLLHNEYEYKGLVEGDYSTTLNAKKIIINNNIDRKNTLSLISKEELTLGQSIRARILSIATQADLRNTKDISATNLLSITAKNIENSGNLYSNGNTYLEAKNGEILGVKTVTLVGDKLNNLSGVVRSYGKVKLNEKDVSNVEGYILSDGITKEQAQNWKVEEKAVEESKEDKKDVKEKQEKKEQTTGTLLNIGRLDNTKGIIASLSQTTVNVGKITNNDGKIVSKGAVELTTQ